MFGMPEEIVRIHMREREREAIHHSRVRRVVAARRWHRRAAASAARARAAAAAIV